MDVETMSPLTEARARLAAGHDQLERLIEEILEVPRVEQERLLQLWMPFAAILTAHLDEEDRFMIPALLRVAERDARGLVLEHRHLRSRIAQIDTAIRAGSLAPMAVRSFASEVFAHHRREHALLLCHAGNADED